METWIYSEENFNTANRSGGSTTEFAIFPAGAQYLDRDFIWRLSSACIDEEESSFTKLPDYDRILMVLEGEAVLVHGEQRTVRLSEMEQDNFDGGVKTKCFGKIKDYTLMFRKGCYGNMQLLEAENSAKFVETKNQDKFSDGSYGFYCLSGYAVISAAGETHMIRKGQQMIFNFSADEHSDMTLMGEGQTIFTQTLYNKEEHVAEEIPEEKATVQDFCQAFKLSYSTHKWSRVLGRNKNVWYDEALQKQLKFLDRTYITLIIWMVGTIACAVTYMTGFSESTAMVLVAVWTLLHLFLISPFIYMIVLPKPIKAHIKEIDKLTEYERKLYEKELESNPALDRIFKKYKNSGKNADDREVL